jgi:hypothetical protein
MYSFAKTPRCALGRRKAPPTLAGYSTPRRTLRGLGDQCTVDAVTGLRICGPVAEAANAATGQSPTGGTAGQPRFAGTIYTVQATPRYGAATITGSMNGPGGKSDPHSVWNFAGYDGDKDIYLRSNVSQAWARLPDMWAQQGVYPRAIVTSITFVFVGCDGAADVYKSSDGAYWGVMTAAGWQQGTGTYPRAVSQTCPAVAGSSYGYYGAPLSATVVTSSPSGVSSGSYITSGGAMETAYPSQPGGYESTVPAAVTAAPSGLMGAWTALPTWGKVAVGGGGAFLVYKAFIKKGR